MNDDQISAHLRNLSNEEFLNAFADNETLCGPFAAEMRRRINEELVISADTLSEVTFLATGAFGDSNDTECPGCENCEPEVGQ